MNDPNNVASYEHSENPIKRAIYWLVTLSWTGADFFEITQELSKELEQYTDQLIDNQSVYIDGLEHQRNNLIDKMAAAMDRIAFLEGKRDELAEQRKDLAEENTRLRRQIGWIKTLEDTTLERDKLAARVEFLEGTIDPLRVEFNKALERVGDLTSALDDLLTKDEHGYIVSSDPERIKTAWAILTDTP